MNSFAQNMKSAIVNDLQSLVNTGVLGAVVTADYTKVFVNDYSWPKFPSALVTPPTVSASEYADTANNLREYTWSVKVVTTTDNLPSTDPTYLEGLMDALLNKFDQDVTLQGMSVGGVAAAVLEPPGPISSTSVTYVVFDVVLKAKALVPAAVQSAS